MQESCEDPDPPVIVVGERLHEILGELRLTLRLTVPVKPFIGATVALKEAVDPVVVETLDGFAATEKSGAFVAW